MCEVTTMPVSIPVSGVLPPEFYDSAFPGVQSGAGATLLSTGSAVFTLPTAVVTATLSESPRNYTDVVVPFDVNLTHYFSNKLGATVPEIPTPAMVLIGLAGIGLGFRHGQRRGRSFQFLNDTRKLQPMASAICLVDVVTRGRTR